MKRERGMSLIVLTIIIIAIIAIGAVAVLLITKGNNDDTNVGQVNPSAETNYDTEQNNDASNEDSTTKVKFWVDDYKNWGEQKETLDLALFDGKFTAPINLKTADNFIKEVSYFPNGFGKTKAKSISDVLNSDTMINSDTSVWLDYGELNEYGSYNDSIKVVLENFNEIETSMKECFDNNWWCISSLSVQDALGLTTDDEDYNASWDARPLLDEIISTLGGPKHIFTYLKGDGEYKSISYGMYYEYSDFAIEIRVMEIDTGNNYSCKINGVTYAPKEYWEKCMYEIKEDYTDFEIMK